MPFPHCPSIEIIERRKPGEGLPEGQPMVPTAIRVDGKEWAVAADRPVKIDSIEVGGHDGCLVTFTVFARRVRIDSEEAA